MNNENDTVIEMPTINQENIEQKEIQNNSAFPFVEPQIHMVNKNIESSESFVLNQEGEVPVSNQEGEVPVTNEKGEVPVTNEQVNTCIISEELNTLVANEEVNSAVIIEETSETLVINEEVNSAIIAEETNTLFVNEEVKVPVIIEETLETLVINKEVETLVITEETNTLVANEEVKVPVIAEETSETLVINEEVVKEELDTIIITIDTYDNVNDDNVETITTEINTEKKPMLDQDTLQRLNVSVQVLLEMYRVITSSLLILFVPQLCDDHICTTTENLVWETSTYNAGLCFNFISMAFLVNMYYLELVRENRLIKYLGVNPNLANDNEEVGIRLELLSHTKKNKIFTINKYYRLSSYAALIIYALNMMVSAAAINKYYAGSQTTSTFITYVLFIATKFGSVHSLVSTDKNIFYSAYIKANVQFNDVDEDNKQKIININTYTE